MLVLLLQSFLLFLQTIVLLDQRRLLPAQLGVVALQRIVAISAR